MKRMMHFAVTILFSNLLFALCAVAQADGKEKLWQVIPSIQNKSLIAQKATTQKKAFSFENATLVKLNKLLLTSHLQLSKQHRIQSKNLNLVPQFDISVPLSDGSTTTITVEKETVMDDALSAKFPSIQTYRVLANDKVFSGKLDYSDSGFHGMLQMHNGETVFIDPVEAKSNVYAVYKKGEQKLATGRHFSCGVDHKDKDLNKNFSFASPASRNVYETAHSKVARRSPQSLINYRIAVATTREYSAKFGSLSATLAAITTTISRVNQVLERDLGIHLNLVANNELLIADSGSDSFNKTSSFDLIMQNQDFIDATIGNENYDVGHLFTTSGGGLAAIASVCHPFNKAKGISGISSPFSDSFDIDFVAHELGHQLGATHTFNSTQGACSESTRTARSAFEPGSGTTIMSYAGHCGLDNIQSGADAMFHIGSIKQIKNYTQLGVGNRCGIKTTSNNTAPVVDAGKDYSIPARTPFELTGKAVDGDGDSLIHAWEQLDAGESSVEYADTGDNALFRAHLPTTSTHRSFPPLRNVINHIATRGETLAISERTINLSFVAQDGFNPAQSDEMKVKVIRTGSRFALNYPKTYYIRGETVPVFWNVANTNQSPINCSSVDVSLSTNGGNSFSHQLATNVPNNGSTQVTIPSGVNISSQGRFKIKCSDNIFYAISYRNFFVTDDGDSISVNFGKENLPEDNLADVDPSSVVAPPAYITSSDNGNSTSSGGGLFDYLYFLILMLLLRKKYSHKAP